MRCRAWIIVFLFLTFHSNAQSQSEVLNTSVSAALDCLNQGSENCWPEFEEAIKSINKYQDDAAAVDDFISLGTQRMRTGRYDTLALELFEKAYERGLSAGLTCKTAEAHFAITRYGRFMGEVNKALDRATKAKEVALNCGDSSMIARASVFIGSAHYMQSDFSKALKHYQEAEKLYASIGDSSGMAGLMLDYAALYSEMREKPRSLAYTKRAAKIFEETGEELKYAIALVDLGADFVDLDMPDSALVYLPLAEPIVVGRHARANAYLEQNYGGAYHMLRDYDKAVYHYKKGLALAQSLGDGYLIGLITTFLAESNWARGNSEEAFKYALISDSVSALGPKNIKRSQSILALAESSYRVGEYDLSYQSFKKYVRLRDSLLGSDKRREIAALEQAFEAEKRDAQIILQQKENDLLEQKNAAASNRLLALGSFTALLIVLGLAVINRQKVKAKMQDTQLELSKVENEKLSQEVKFKNRELTSKALLIARNNEMLRELRSNLDELQQKKSSDEVRALMQEIDLNEIQSNNWDDFTTQFNELNPAFYKSITSKNEGLTRSDIRLAALLRMGLSSKDIASMLNISEDGIKKARYRLRKKLQLNSDDSLETEILKF
jgi:tetratricopeptide (TPR) repeat protein